MQTEELRSLTFNGQERTTRGPDRLTGTELTTAMGHGHNIGRPSVPKGCARRRLVSGEICQPGLGSKAKPRGVQELALALANSRAVPRPQEHTEDLLFCHSRSLKSANGGHGTAHDCLQRSQRQQARSST